MSPRYEGKPTLIGCLHHCLATGQPYLETIAFPHPQTHQNVTA
jgi:hypothetical protein